LTAIKAKQEKVMDYIYRLDNYDGPQLANICQEEQYALFDQALCIYKKFNLHLDAIKVMLYKLNNYEGDMNLASEFAEKTNIPEVWSELGSAQLDKFMLKECISSFIKAKNPSKYMMVINIGKNQDCYEELIQFLLMARKSLKERIIDSELIFSYAKCGDKYLGEIENFINEPNQADMVETADRCFENRNYQAAKLLYQKANNNQKLAVTYVMLQQYQQALDSAKVAGIPKVWKQVCFACVRAREFKHANTAAQNIIIHPDHLEDLIQFYEKFGFFKELISTLEQGLNHERAHPGIFTELGSLYAKYQPNSLMDFIHMHSAKIMIPKLIRACEMYQMWSEACVLNVKYEQWDKAVIIMIEHSPTAFNHQQFVQNIIKVSNFELYYRAMSFYLEEQPMQLNDLLNVLSKEDKKFDLVKCVQHMKRTGYIALIEPFLKRV
jgi:clathrin heavy chain